MSLKDDWKDAGKSIGKSFERLGRTIAKSAKVGLDKVAEDDPDESTEKQGPAENPGKEGAAGKKSLKESWTEVGHGFGKAGKSFGHAAAQTARTVADAVDPDESSDAADRSGQENAGSGGGSDRS